MNTWNQHQPAQLKEKQIHLSHQQVLITACAPPPPSQVPEHLCSWGLNWVSGAQPTLGKKITRPKNPTTSSFLKHTLPGALPRGGREQHRGRSKAGSVTSSCNHASLKPSLGMKFHSSVSGFKQELLQSQEQACFLASAPSLGQSHSEPDPGAI